MAAEDELGERLHPEGAPGFMDQMGRMLMGDSTFELNNEQEKLKFEASLARCKARTAVHNAKVFALVLPPLCACFLAWAWSIWWWMK